MTREEIRDVLGEIEPFADLTPDERAKVAQWVLVKQWKAGEVLFRTNDPRRGMLVIIEGAIELVQDNTLGGETRIVTFRERDFLGEGALLDDYPHATTGRAMEDTTALVLHREDLESFAVENPDAARRIIGRVARVISRRLRQASARVASAAAQYVSGRTRREHDLLGEREVPHEFYYGVQTLRALENFNISGIPISHFPSMIEALAIVKMAAARANRELGLLPVEIAEAIVTACGEILDGKWHTHFVVDMIQGGAGTSTNMNANEVIANRALELLGHEKGEYEYCHPNNHVNLSQSTNDVYPTAIKIALFHSNEEMVKILKELVSAFRRKADEFAGVIKMGRTQLQDAVPMTLGQEFGAYAATLAEEVVRLNQMARLFLEVNMGGTAIGTGINADPEYPSKVVAHLREITGMELSLAPNLVEATQDTGSFVMYSSALKRLAVKLSKISNDLRLLSSGPRAGLNEINLPKMQPGSSIMPGKVNPVIPEVVNQVAFKVIGNDLTVTLASEAGQLELNVMEPVIMQSIFESIEELNNGMSTLRIRCIEGITANEEQCREQVQRSIGLVTALNPVLGYETSSALAKEALESGRGVYELVLEKGLLDQEELDKLLAPESMVRPRRTGR
ncbi:MAG TPA: aspartate ammonia-lyase [Bacteroidetes bacterium]|nr:aspartate ammonia-lyase [Bacteroidota bacterium]